MIFLLENIRSKHNIGSIFRTCDCFQINELIIIGYSVFPPDKDLSKTAIGAEKVVNWRYFQKIEDAISSLKKEGKKIIAIEINKKAKNIYEYKLEGNEVFIFGNEIEGVSDKAMNLCDETLKIPMNGKIKESLNVGISAGIVGAFIFENG